MKTSVALFFLIAVTLHQSNAGPENAEVSRVMSRFNALTARMAAHKSQFTEDDIAEFGKIKDQIFKLIGQGILVASGQTYPWYPGMHQEFYRIQSDSPSEKTMVSLPATTETTAHEHSGSHNWAHDQSGRRFYDLKDEGKSVAHVYFPATEEEQKIYAVNRWQLGKPISNDEVLRLLKGFAIVTGSAAAHKPQVTGVDIAAFGGIKSQISSLISRGVLVATGQTYPWYGGMYLEFYRVHSLSPSTKEWAVLPATSNIRARERSGAPPNWAYDKSGWKYFDLRDGDKTVVKVYFPAGEGDL